MSGRPNRVTGLRIAGVAAAYLVTALLGLNVSSAAGAVTLIWAPAGIGLAAVLRWGPWMATGAVLGNLATSFASGSAPLFASFAAAAALLGALGGAFLLRRARFDGAFESARDVLYFVVLAGILSTLASAAVGASGLALDGRIEWTGWIVAWMNWWVGDAMGVLIVAPVLICWPGAARLRATIAGRALEVTALVGLLTVLCAVIFRTSAFGSTVYPMSFLVGPPVLWAAFRFRPFGAAVTTLIVSGFAVWSTLAGAGPFSAGARDESIRVMWAFMAVAAGTALTVASVVATRDRSELSLLKNQSWLHLIESSMDAGTWLWDAETGEIQGSAQQLRLIGFDPGDVEQNLSNAMGTVAPEHRQRVWETLATAASEGGLFELDFRVEGPDGRTRWHMVKGRRIPKNPSWPKGPYQLIGINLDITERKNIADALRRSERLASLGTFAAGVAHEINNPIGTILLAAQSAQSAGNAATVSNALDDIVDDARRMGQIVKRVLQFATSEASEHRVEDLNPILGAAVALIRSYTKQRGVSIQAERTARPLCVTGSAIELEQVFVNLLRNAVEACSPGGQVRLTARISDREARIGVHDNGSGIRDELLARVFDPFFTTRAETGGSGLGLSICHGIVESHGGHIDVVSKSGAGTTITVSLPLQGADETTPPAAPTGS